MSVSSCLDHENASTHNYEKCAKHETEATGSRYGLRVCFHGNWELVLSRSLFARMETGNESLDRGAPQPGGPPVVKAALVPLHFHVPPGKRRVLYLGE